MQRTSASGLRLMIVDDDALSREVVAVLAADAGFCVETHETGDSALQALAASNAGPPDIILADLQMPGLCGEPLAKLLRAAAGRETILLAMSGTSVPCEVIRSFDAFVLKPFSMDEICTAFNRPRAPLATPPPDSHPDHTGPDTVLNRKTYDSLAEVIPKEQLQRLYAMCLDDADARIETLRKASLNRDPDAWIHSAHSIKGGCGMLGAVELARLATDMERTGLPAVGNIAALDEFLVASSRLRRILNAQN